MIDVRSEIQVEVPQPQAELIFGFVYGVGTNVDPVVFLLKEYLRQFSYTTHEFRVSEHLRTLELAITFDEMECAYERRKRGENSCESK